MAVIDTNIEQTMIEFRKRWKSNKRLSVAEIEELLGYEFVVGPSSIEGQIRRYYLLVKRDCQPSRAEQMLKEVKPFLKRGVRNDQDVHDLSIVLSRHISGFVIHLPPTKEMQDEMAVKHPLPLKIRTSRASKCFQVWRGRSKIVQYKAWRIGRPTIIGYGMTEQEAIDDLRYRVQPDLDGTLDGKGNPEGPMISGNMFDESEIVEHNKRRFN